jgi:hypothetical protein
MNADNSRRKYLCESDFSSVANCICISHSDLGALGASAVAFDPF